MKTWLRRVGPGVITGAADDDPSGIASYSQAGALFGLQMLWTVLFTYPLMVGIQIVSARIGRVSGRGLAANIRKHYSRGILYLIVSLLLIANTVNIAADISAMGEAMSLIVGGPSRVYVVVFGLVSMMLQVIIPYHKYVYFLKWLTLSLFAYVATIFVIHVPWGEVLRATVMPDLLWRSDYFTTVVAVFGTTISPYLFFWQASQEVEEAHADPRSHSLRWRPEEAPFALKKIQIDTYLGMGFSNLVAFCIILTSALVLHSQGIGGIQTSAQAALALKPLAGDFAFILFSLGIVGTGLLAIPVLAGSAAYAVAEALHWRSGLELKPARAKGFYGIIVASIFFGVIFGVFELDPIKALYWSAVLNGVISVPIMAIMMLMAVRKDIMGELVISKKLQLLGWGSVFVMALAVVAMFLTF